MNMTIPKRAEPQEIDQLPHPTEQTALRSRAVWLRNLALTLLAVNVTEDVAMYRRGTHITSMVMADGNTERLRADVDELESLILELRDYTPRGSFLHLQAELALTNTQRTDAHDA